jgi:hypothetical protein
MTSSLAITDQPALLVAIPVAALLVPILTLALLAACAAFVLLTLTTPR